VLGIDAVARLGRDLASELGPPVLEHVDPLADAREGLLDLRLEGEQHLAGVAVGAGGDIASVRLRSGDDPPALGLGSLGQAPFADQEGRLLLGPARDPGGLLVGLLEDPLALGVDPLRRLDLLRNGDPELIDEVEDRVAIDEDPPGAGDAGARRDL
jgi:hypothetical protein